MDCDVIKDLMPIYIEKLTSEPSNRLIEDHVKDCTGCKQMLSKLQEDIIIDNNEEEFNELEKLPTALIKKIKKNIYEKIFIIFAVTLFFGIVIGVFNAKIFMFVAFLGSTSILAFTTAICVSLVICKRKSSLKRKFKSLGNWSFLLSIAFCGLLFIIFRFYFNETAKIVTILSLEILYNAILSLTLRIYARFKLPQNSSISSEKQTSKKLYIVTFITLTFIIAIIAIPATLLEKNRKVDNLNLNFVSDSEVINKWTVIDFVSNPQMFNPDKQPKKGGLLLNTMTFSKDGQLNITFNSKEGRRNANAPTPWLSWTKGYVINKGGDHNLSKYYISEINGSKYLFYEWKTGDYIYFNQQPKYYVLKKQTKN